MNAGAVGVGGLAIVAAVSACAAAPQPEPRVEASSPDVEQLALGRDGFAMCDGCHSLDPGRASGMGPSLHDIAGRQAGSLSDYPYSDALAASDVIWDAASLDAFLADPSGFIPGSEMQRGMVRDPELRGAIVAYLLSANES